jgi:hypothetical protein
MTTPNAVKFGMRHRTPVDEKYRMLGEEGGFLGLPTTDELISPDKEGHLRHYKNGSIYWSPRTHAAHEVHGEIKRRWAETGWEMGPLGYPTTDEILAPDGTGRLSHFEKGSIYWTHPNGAHEVLGPIRDLWASMGWEHSLLGYPITNEIPSIRGGRLNHFQHGSIYYTPTTGAHEVHGAIRDRWAEMDWEHGPLGYPVTSEFRTFDLADEGGNRLRISAFEHGFIAFNEADHSVRVVVPSDYRGLTLLVTPIYWGREWDPGNPTCPGQGWSDVDKALDDILSAGVASGLQGYGIANVVKVRGTWRGNDAIPSHFWHGQAGFTEDELTQSVNDAIFQHGAPTPTHTFLSFEGLPHLSGVKSVYLVFLPSGCWARDHAGAAGYHSNKSFDDPEGRLPDIPAPGDDGVSRGDHKICWIGQGAGALSHTLDCALHELVEALDDAAGTEIADRCKKGDDHNPDNAGFTHAVAGITLNSYWSNFHNRCILPPIPDPNTRQWPVQ